MAFIAEIFAHRHFSITDYTSTLQQDFNHIKLDLYYEDANTIQ